jgi:hypothetical protein
MGPPSRLTGPHGRGRTHATPVPLPLRPTYDSSAAILSQL